MSGLDQTLKGMKYDDQGLLTAVIVDATTKDVLMVAHMDDQALRETIRTGKTHFWSRTRRQRWMKGQQSGHVQQVKAIYTDCDKDCVVIEVDQVGGACHEGYRSCFYRRLTEGSDWKIVAQQVFDPKQVYKDKKG
ncbi:MAG: phosphoribosyl-AMP cyclohydrolase [Phycisphaerae bacterium]|nr:phosphoribosyl-AMP cyclohydrolase [Phycisphaerae bacterium]